MLTNEEIRSRLNYDPETGIFTWRRVSKTAWIKVGSVAGTVNHHGYVMIKFANKQFSAHRLAFLCMNGEFPDLQVDHINGIRTDNRWENLRLVTNQQNGWNRTNSQKNNTAGYKGIMLNSTRKKWRAYVEINGKKIYNGTYSTKEEAALAYNELALAHFGEYARLNEI